MQTREASLYDHPEYYDLVFGSDWKAEFDFLRDCFDRYAQREVWRLFEPACGTGRLMYRLAKEGYEVAGNDLSQQAVDYCNKRLARHDLPATAVVGDMCDFRVRRKVDAAFNLINTFRHLHTEKQAVAHLECVSEALAKGGIYVLGLHLIPKEGERVTEESWSARRGNLAVLSHMQSAELDMRRRRERFMMTFDVYTPKQQFRLAEQIEFRTYTAAQMRLLLDKVPQLKIVGVHDFAYDVDEDVEIDHRTEDVVYVLRKV
ncbi:MAG: class I SAM-dependent methyltransferase [Pirellulales bacterium]|nr:class I SAM-dependent methyltransferase [Pirellulales bacterium]